MRGLRERAVRRALRIGGAALALSLLAVVATGAVDEAGPRSSDAQSASGALGAAAAPAVPEPGTPLASPPEVAVHGGSADPAPEGEEAMARAAAPPSAATPSLLELAWRAPAPDLPSRVARVRRASFELGVWSFDAAARLLANGRAGMGDLERAAAAVELAPDLPAAHMGLARALWLRGGEPMAALRALVGALQAIGRHLEASLWFTGSALYLLAVALVGGGLLCVALAALSSLPHAAHDLGHLVSRSLPDFARYATLAALLGVPLALGEGLLGLALGLLGIGAIYGGRPQRRAIWLAAAGIGLGAYPVVRHAGVALAALPEDPVARAAWSVSQGLSTPVELARLQAASASDPLATRGLAIHARRLGNLAEADAHYQRLLAGGAGDVAVLNNAANVRLELGHMERAIELYKQAVSRRESPVVLFNLAQAYGRAFQVEDLNDAIARAQQLGGDRVAQFTALQGSDTQGFVVDHPISFSLFWSRALEAMPGADVASEFRRPFAPGLLGRDARLLAVAMALVLLAGGWIGSRGEPSRWCARCGSRVCARCDARSTSGELCEGCKKLFYQPEQTDRMLRIQRVNELRVREARMDRLHSIVSLAVPGAAGLLAKRPLSAWLGTTCFVLAVAGLVWREGVVPDPLVAGTAAPVVFLGVAGLAGAVYAFTVASSLAARRNG